MLAEQAEALRWLDLMCGWASGQDWMPVWIYAARRWRRELLMLDRDARGAAAARRSSAEVLREWVEMLDLDESAEVRLSLPIPRAGELVRSCTVLWAVTRGPAQALALNGLPTPPHLVLAVGGDRYAFWALEAPMPAHGVVRANRRLAYRLGSVQRHGEPDRLEVPAPGAFVRADRTRPVPVLVERCVWETASWPAVIGRLRDAPGRDGWREQAPRRVSAPAPGDDGAYEPMDESPRERSATDTLW